MKPKKGDKVMFPDGHAQRVLDVVDHLDDTIVYLNRAKPTDDDWVYFSHLYYSTEYRLWKVGRNV